MAKQRLITPEQAEEIRTKDFFDLIAPSTIRIAFRLKIGFR